MQFDGVYYQKLMEKVCKIDDNERDAFIGPVKSNRIYGKGL